MVAPLFLVIIDKEYDGRWIAEIIHFPGALSYGRTRDEAILNVFNIARIIRRENNLQLWC